MVQCLWEVAKLADAPGCFPGGDKATSPPWRFESSPSSHLKNMHALVIYMSIKDGAWVRVEASRFQCPLCGSEIEWRCWPNEGFARCTKSLDATHSWLGIDSSMPATFCGWSGKTRRAKNGKVMILYRLRRFNDKRST